MGGSTEVSSISFVRFGELDSLEAEADVDLSGVTLDLDVQATPDAYFELVFPTPLSATSHERSRQWACGAWRELRRRPDMIGQVELVKDYLFTLRNIVNKRFEVQPGGRIIWYGDPSMRSSTSRRCTRCALYDIVPPNEHGGLPQARPLML
ncbi:MAG: hypothetical protein IPJ85_11990 [Flavobacteriales bacterium]|nr:hypothetical protein [Flavobacteriales bacterium]